MDIVIETVQNVKPKRDGSKRKGAVRLAIEGLEPVEFHDDGSFTGQSFALATDSENGKAILPAIHNVSKSMGRRFGTLTEYHETEGSDDLVRMTRVFRKV